MIRNSIQLFLTLAAFTSCMGHKPSVPLFYNKALEDSLEHYIFQAGEIKNPYNAPTIIDIWIKVEDMETELIQDTLVFIAASYEIGGPPAFQESVDGPIIPYQCTIRGACRINGRICVVKYINNTEVPELVNTKILTIPAEQYDFFSSYRGPVYNVRISRSSRLYRISENGSVSLIEKDVGDFERQ